MEGIKKFKRIGSVISILSKYGFDDFISRTKLEKYLPTNLFKRIKFDNEQINFYTRVRLALEELGPTYVKLGQMLSNREDLLPKELTFELQLLQDNVPPEPISIKHKMEVELGIDFESSFAYVDEVPIASASISQVYKAQLKTGEWVVLKVKREHIEGIIRADILIMKDLARLLENRYESAKQMNLSQIVSSFESNMYRELSFLNEFNNIERFRKNFANEPTIHVPLAYREFSNNNILCMEFVSGAKVNDISKIKEYGLSPIEVNKIGLDLYLRQILDHGFFHADPHAGNVFLLPNHQFCFIDFGSMGSIMPTEREQLEAIMTNFIFKDAKKVIRAVKKLALYYQIPDEKTLEKDIYDIFDILDYSALNDINATVIIDKLKTIMQKNHVLLPEFVYLLFRGIIIVEGMGKQLDPEMNIVTSIRPYALKYAKEKFQFKRIIKHNLTNARTIYDSLQSFPDDISMLLEKIKSDNFMITHKVDGLEDMRKTLQNLGNRLVYALIIAAMSIGSSILVMAQMPPLIFGVPLLGVFGFLISGILGITIIISIYKKDSD